MDDILKYYLANTLATPPVMAGRLMNPITHMHYPERQVYARLQKYADDFFAKGAEPRFISLTGLRGVGKTTLLWQMANHISNRYGQSVYFFNVNTLKNLNISLFTALEAFQQHIIQQRFNALTTPIVLLFDEVQDDEKWAQTLKILYDEARTAFILCTGSSALLLNSTADLSRRMYLQRVFPYSFSELLTVQNAMQPALNLSVPDRQLSEQLKAIIFYSEDAHSCHQQLIDIQGKVQPIIHDWQSQLPDLPERYINYLNFPNLLFYDDLDAVYQTILDLLKRIIYEDIPMLKPAYSDLGTIEKLMLRLAGSDEVNPERLAGIIGMKQQAIHELMDLLVKAELMHVLLPFGGLDSRINKHKKAFFMSPSLRRALLYTLYGQTLPEQFRSKLLEDIVMMYLKKTLTESIISFTGGSAAANPDFVIETRERPLVLEVGTHKTSIAQARAIPARYGLLVSGGSDTPLLKENTVQIPFNWFLLL
ncbi:MAG: AAA family ATPase [Cytophagales bacterium]|nr:AAA family ATPase [Bernardetiaceae bacterium]MDW8203386.1 AAA family ATPase [Cytophagales bacterium]